MEQKRSSIPMQVQAFRRRRWRARWPWALGAVLVALLLIWLVSRSPGESTPQTSAPVSETQVAGKMITPLTLNISSVRPTSGVMRVCGEPHGQSPGTMLVRSWVR